MFGELDQVRRTTLRFSLCPHLSFSYKPNELLDVVTFGERSKVAKRTVF